MSLESFELQKYLGNSEFENFQEELLSIEVNGFNSIDFSLQLGEEKEDEWKWPKQFKLPNQSHRDLQSLLNHFELIQFENEFLSLMAVVQSNYIIHNDEMGELENYFNNEKESFDKLLQVLESYLFDGQDDLHAISFKYKSGGPSTIKNFFVNNGIMNGLLNYFELNVENFKMRSQELLSKYYNDFDYRKGKEFVKVRLVQSLFKFFKSQKHGISDNQILKACGVLLHICQIPSNNNIDSVEVGEIEDALVTIEHQNMRHYNNGRIKFTI